MTKLVALFTLALLGCGSSASKTSITFSQGQFPAEARAIVLLWGYDERVADIGASLVADYELVIPAGTPLSIEIPSNPHELIDQGLGPVEAADARYYFDISVDLNGDGELCPGELRQDFEASEFSTFATPPTSLDVALTEIEAGNNCQPTVPQ